MEDLKEPGWIKVVARNQAVLHFSAMLRSGHAGYRFGDIEFRVARQMAIKYDTPLTHAFNFSDGFWETNFDSLIQEINPKVDDGFSVISTILEKNLSLQPGDDKKDCIDFYNCLKSSTGIMLVGIYFGMIVQSKLEEIVGKAWVEKHQKEIFYSGKNTIISRENKIIEKVRDDFGSGKIKKEELGEIAKNLAKEFGYIHSEYRAKAWGREEYQEEIERKVEPIGEKEEIEESVKLDGAGKPEDYVQWLIKVAGLCSFYYDEGKAAVVRSNWALRQTFKKMGVGEEKILRLSEDEFLHWAESEFLTPNQPDDDRDKYYAIRIWNDGVSEYFTKDDVDKIIEEEGIIEFQSVERKSSLKGLIAFAGKIQGTARIIFSQKEQDKIKEGDILITSMTTPELIGAMRRAGAFVTDEGGILSHAAVVAREFKKPCIVGTGTATRIIKDGDLVEVDADHGVVRILERSGGSVL